ncbi:amidohydrolase [Candidatus Rariloculus sp.]|uniref:amidohydrolase n=1 Tax=Candidatus Rariloculus sp. TaxID=3101265 RepID=UPI003D0EDBDF
MTARKSGSAISVLLLASAGLAVSTAIAQPAPDLVLTNGKIITVDERFTIAEAVAVRGDRIVAVGASSEILALSEPGTSVLDLGGRAVIPGLIDNHMHLLRAGTTWTREVRWDGVGSRSAALGMLRDKASAVGPGEWIFTLGGWTVDQFADDPSPLLREELDEAVPDNPVLLQAAYYRGYLNSLALETFGLDDGDAPAWVVRDAAGRPTGEIEEAGIRSLAGRLPTPSSSEIEASTQSMIRDLNEAGLTAFGSAGCAADVLAMYRRWADQGELGVRVFCITGVGAGNPAQVDAALPRIAQLRFFQGDEYIDHVTFGEGVYGPLHDPMFLVKSDYGETELAEWRRIVTEVARAGLPLHVHANLRDTLSRFLDQIEIVNTQYPVRNLRWAFAHANQLEESHLSRMKALGMYAAVHPWAVINGGINHSVFGDEAYDMAPLSTIQNSGITWGFGSDGSRANQILPFTTLWWAVTGKMVGGETVLRQTIGREDALIAHTRKNAYLIFQEDNLGSIQPGKLADLVVLDRDYLTIRADEIKDIEPLMTIVGGRIVYDAGL